MKRETITPSYNLNMILDNVLFYVFVFKKQNSNLRVTGSDLKIPYNPWTTEDSDTYQQSISCADVYILTIDTYVVTINI